MGACAPQREDTVRKDLAMITIRKELIRDIDAREALLDLSFGEARFRKASERLREGRMPASGLAFVACDRGRVVGTARLWNVVAGPLRPALLLGPIAVHPDYRCRGLGRALVERSLADAKRLDHRAVLLVGDAPYYGRFGFSAELTEGLWLPGSYDADRFLALELQPGALAGARGLVSAAGRRRRNLPLANSLRHSSAIFPRRSAFPPQRPTVPH
jgi:predicted N-acetyltransferase YhbS